MILLCRRQQSGWLGLVAALACWCGLPALVAGQPVEDPLSASRPASWVVEIAAEEDALWLGRVGPLNTEMYRRGISESFEAVRPLRARVAKMAAVQGVLYAFTEDGEFMSFRTGAWSREQDLPGRGVPVDIVASDRELYAMFASPVAGDMARLVGGIRPPTSQPFDAGAAELSIARYDSQGWVAVAACPRELGTGDSEHLKPRLGVVRDKLCVFWLLSDGRSVAYAHWDGESDRWRDSDVAPPRERLSGFWFANVSRVPALVTSVVDAAGGETFEMLRLFGDLGTGPSAWRRSRLRLSGLPADVAAGECTAVLGFNQHVALLLTGTDGQPYVRFGRGEAGPAEKTIALAELFERRSAGGERQEWLQKLTFMLLLGSVLSLFLFRRGAMVAVLPLPPNCAVALIMQRVIALVIDLVPFLIVFSVTMGVDWQAGFSEMLGWAVVSDAAGVFPASETLLWWCSSCASYTAYSLLMELLTRRTVGKVLLGTRVISETAYRPRVWQIIVRNLFRFIELIPPLWLIGFVVVLSRNRQRLGDIFARTIVVRRVAVRDDQPAGDQRE